MSLLLTAMTDQGIVFAADRNISADGVIARRRKILSIEHLEAAIGYIGNSCIGTGWMDEWLEDTIETLQSDCATLKEFAEQLGRELEKTLTSAQKQLPLAIHIAGYTDHEDRRLQTFWFVRNVCKFENFEYDEVIDTFIISEDYLSRDRLSYVERGIDLHKLHHIYRNGTLAPYVEIAKHITSLFQTIRTLREDKTLRGFEEFRPPSTLEDFATLYAFHIQLAADIYEFFSSSQARPIGGGVDVVTISPGGTTKYRHFPPRGKLIVSDTIPQDWIRHGPHPCRARK